MANGPKCSLEPELNQPASSNWELVRTVNDLLSIPEFRSWLEHPKLSEFASAYGKLERQLYGGETLPTFPTITGNKKIDDKNFQTFREKLKNLITFRDFSGQSRLHPEINGMLMYLSETVPAYLRFTAQHAFQRRPEVRDRVWLWKSGSDDLERFGATQIGFISPGGHNDAGFRLQSADLFNKG